VLIIKVNDLYVLIIKVKDSLLMYLCHTHSYGTQRVSEHSGVQEQGPMKGCKVSSSQQDQRTDLG
jgi:hypothetical protein